jgi:hypothetical protein
LKTNSLFKTNPIGAAIANVKIPVMYMLGINKFNVFNIPRLIKYKIIYTSINLYSRQLLVLAKTILPIVLKLNNVPTMVAINKAAEWLLCRKMQIEKTA